MNWNCKYWLILLIFFSFNALSQTCPPNIGFENGTLDNWQCSAGFIERDGTLNLSPSPPIIGRHTIFANTFPQQVDPYGGFPVNCPNGSAYSVRLGNSLAGGEAEGMSYTFTIPANQNDYSLIYNYAVVFQNPPHRPWEQPRFTSNIFNVTDNKYIECGSFQFVASSDLPGFSMTRDSVYYKPWSPVTVNLSGLAGKTVRLEFTTNDCAYTKHFGYAYLDVNENCASSPILGTTYCAGAQSLILTAPYGFASYKWFNSDFSQVLGTGNILTISPPPPANTNYAVEVIPYQGLGCQDTLFTSIKISDQPFNLNVIDSIVGCLTGVDLTTPAVTAGSSAGLTYSYYLDQDQINYLGVPKNVTESGIYYIKGENASGCHDIKPIRVIIKSHPDFEITDPAGVCVPQTVDITSPAITAGSDAANSYTYWQDADTTIGLPNPSTINTSGIYYIKAASTAGCSMVKPVNVKIGTIPNLMLHDPVACGQANLTAPAITFGSTPNLTFTYWQDALTTIGLQNPSAVMQSGTYYITGTSDTGCSISHPISVTINPVPVFTVTDPKPVKFPVTTIDITSAVQPTSGIIFSFWQDSLAQKPVASPSVIDKAGTYYIKGTNEYGCSTIQPVKADIIPSPEPVIYAPNAFTPNNDGLNDGFKIKVLGEITIRHFKIFNRWGQVVYDDPDLSHIWNGKYKGEELPMGAYVWALDGYDEYYKRAFTKNGIITLIR